MKRLSADYESVLVVPLTWSHSDFSGVFVDNLDLFREAVLLHDATGCVSHGLKNLETHRSRLGFVACINNKTVEETVYIISHFKIAGDKQIVDSNETCKG